MITKIVLASAVAFLGFSALKPVNAQGWYDANWLFRRPVSIANSGSATLTDYQAKIILDNSFDFEQCNSDGSDIRITSSDGTTAIPFWTEEWNPGTSATIWVRVPSIPVAGATVYLYYGNSGAASSSNGPATFRFFDDFETWNATSGSTGWTDIASLPASIADQTSPVYNGNIFSIGGYSNGPTNPQNENFEYNVAANTWTQKASMPTARWGMLGIEFNGKIYVFGGLTGVGTATGVNKNEVYDPVTDTWDTTRNRIPTGLADEGVTGLRVGNKIHLFHLSYHYEYDPVLDTYTQKPGMPTPRYWCTTALVGSKIYLIAGWGPANVSNKNEAYDTLTGAWTTKSPLPIFIWGASRENPVINGKIYVTHGLDGVNFYNTNFCYDPVANSWSLKGLASHARDGVGCGVINNKLYVIGGRNLTKNPTGTYYCEVYDPTLESLPVSPNWTFSGCNYASQDNTTKYQGNYSLQLKQQANLPIEQYIQTTQGFGNSYALDFDWNISDALGIGYQRPQGALAFTETDPDESLYFYNSASNVPVLQWYHSGFQQLQNSTWNNWHKVTAIRNGSNSKVVFDGNSFGPLTSPAGGTGKIRFSIYFETSQNLDNIRVRNWAGLDPSTAVGSEQHVAPPPAPALVSPLNAAIGVSVSPVFSWNASSTAVSYYIQVSPSAEFNFVYEVSGITATSFSMNGLQPNNTYYWHVNASNDRGPGNWSAVWSFTTCPAAPTINAGPDQIICSNATTVTMAGFSFTNASGAFWSGGSGSWNGNIYTPVAADLAAGSITLTYATNTASPCGDVSDNMVVTFVPPPIVSWASALSSQCVSSTSYILTGGLPAGGTYSGDGVTGINFNASLAGTGTHTLVYSYTDPVTLCSGSSVTSILVNPLTPVHAGSYGPICLNAADVILAGTPAGGTWSGTGVTGNPGNGYVFHPSAGTQLLTYSYTDGNSCLNSDPVTITVNPLPVIVTGSYGPVCMNAQDVVLIGLPVGGTWNGTGVSGNQGNGFVFHPSAGTQNLNYSFSDSNGCSNTATTQIVINPLPVVSAGTYPAVSINSAAIPLVGSPSGGIFTGPGVANNLFDPSIAGLGTTIVIYTYTDLNGCTNADTTHIVVLPGGNKSLQVHAYLEGLYTGGGFMTEALDNTGNPRWGTGIADKITVELHDSINYSTIVYSVNNIDLTINGVVSLGGLTGISGNLNGSYYVTIRHRNSIETTSAVPVSFSGENITVSFDSPAHAFAGNLKQMADGVYAIYGGDVNQDGLVDSSDMIAVDNDVKFFATGYIATDANGDGLIDSSDMIMIDNNSKDFIGSILP